MPAGSGCGGPTAASALEAAKAIATASATASAAVTARRRLKSPPLGRRRADSMLVHMRILYVYSRPASFVEIDLQLLRERWDVREWAQPGRYGNPVAVAREVRKSDLVFGWFASWHTFLPFAFARLLGKPSLLVTGGFDTANVPEIGYGYQRGGAAKRPPGW